MWGKIQLGFYSKAYSLLALPINQITAPIASVAIPALSRLQNDPDEYARYFYRAINVIGFLTMPMMMFLAAQSREIVLIVLGSQWSGAVPIFKILAIAALLQPVISPVGWVYVSLGQTDRMLRYAFFFVPVLVTSFFVGLPWGAYGVAVSYTICFIVLTILPSLWWAFRKSPITIRGWLRSIRCPISISLIIYFVIDILCKYLFINFNYLNTFLLPALPLLFALS